MVSQSCMIDWAVEAWEFVGSTETTWTPGYVSSVWTKPPMRYVSRVWPSSEPEHGYRTFDGTVPFLQELSE